MDLKINYGMKIKNQNFIQLGDINQRIEAGFIDSVGRKIQELYINAAEKVLKQKQQGHNRKHDNKIRQKIKKNREKIVRYGLSRFER